MEVRVEKAVVEFRKNPDAVSKKTEEAIKHMGVKPDPKAVERLAAQVDRWWHTAPRAERPPNILQLESCMRRVCRRRCAQWWKITSPNIKKLQPELKGVATRLRKTTTKAEKMYHGGIKTAEWRYNHEEPAPMKGDQRELDRVAEPKGAATRMWKPDREA